MCRREVEKIRDHLLQHANHIRQLSVDLTREHKERESTDTTNVERDKTDGISIKIEKLQESRAAIEKACDALLGVMF